MLYISGPYTSSNIMGVAINIANARAAALWCAERNIPFFCPHTHTAHFEQYAPNVPVEFYYALDLKIAEVCRGVILLEGYEHSYGAQRELEYFRRANKPEYLFPLDCAYILSVYGKS